MAMEAHVTLRFYPAIISKDSDSDYGVTFPDFPGCVSAGGTLDEAVAMGQEALAAHIAWMLREGDSIPAPSTVKAARASVDAGDRGAIVTVQMMPGAVPGRAVRLNVTMEEDLLSRIDADAGHYGRSKWLAEAARQRLGLREAAVPVRFKAAAKAKAVPRSKGGTAKRH